MKLNFHLYAGVEYQSRAKVLTDSINKHHPDSNIILESLPNIAPVGTYIKDFHTKKYQDIFDAFYYGKDNVVFMGSDTEIFSRMIELEVALEEYDVVIVPHIITPVSDRSRMVQFYNTGHINSDCVAFRNSKNAWNIVKWMAKVTDDKVGPGEFYDQTWLSSLPFLFDGVKILRHPGYNNSYWTENIDIDNLRFYHYSGYKKKMYPKMSTHSNRIAEGRILELYRNYDEKL